MREQLNNRNLMLSIMRDFRDGRLETLFEAIDSAVVWHSHAPKELFRFGARHYGRAGVKEYIGLLFSRYHFVRFEPRHVAADGEVVWGLFDTEARHQPSGRYVRIDISLRWIVRQGRITEHQCFFDTASVLMQQGELVAAA